MEKSLATSKANDKSLGQRLIVAGVLVPLVSLFVYLGDLPFAIFIGFALALAAWEYWRIFRVGDFQPSLFILAFFTLAAFWLRYQFQFQYIDLWLSGLILASLTSSVIQQARGIPNAAFNFAITTGGVIYIGWMGAYVVSIRELPEVGLFWTILILFAAAMTDTGGYVFGRLFGNHKIAPALSPKKSWEGYLGGIFFGGLSTWLAAIFLNMFIAGINPIHALIIGLVISAVSPLGDFAESMLKRQFNIKDTSRILASHGGILDRIDSSLWAVVIGYYLLLFLK